MVLTHTHTHKEKERDILRCIRDEFKKELGIRGDNCHLSHVMQDLGLHMPIENFLVSENIHGFVLNHHCETWWKCIAQLKSAQQFRSCNDIIWHRPITYTVSCPISLNDYLNFSSTPLIFVFPFFMYMNVGHIPENLNEACSWLWTRIKSKSTFF